MTKTVSGPLLTSPARAVNFGHSCCFWLKVVIIVLSPSGAERLKFDTPVVLDICPMMIIGGHH